MSPRHYRRENDDKATQDRKRMELLHDMMEGRDNGHLKDYQTDKDERG